MPIVRKQSRNARERRNRIITLRKRDGDMCYLCGNFIDFSNRDITSPEYRTIDHIKPVKYGGSDRQSNLKLAHRKCNEKRGSNTDADKRL